MVWLLHRIHFVVRNYGVAIFILVLLVRGLLHPLSVWQQKNMFRMQESMARVQPKMDAIKERYPNDKVRQQQETMKLYSEEGVKTRWRRFSGCCRCLSRCRSSSALWSSLNTDVSLRHAPFDGYWIKDLSAPDALITFAHPFTIPLLGWTVATLNLLPILMGLSMWLQQKYMPKPRPAQGRAARLRQGRDDARRDHAPAADDGLHHDFPVPDHALQAALRPEPLLDGQQRGRDLRVAADPAPDRAGATAPRRGRTAPAEGAPER